MRLQFKCLVHLCLCIMALALGHTAKAQFLVAQEVTIQANRFTAPIEMCAVPGRPGKVFVAYQPGWVRLLDLDSAQRRAQIVLSLRSLTRQSGELGLLGMAFHPRYPRVNKLYVYFTDNVSRGNLSVYASFNVDTTTLRVDSASRREFLTFAQPFANHNGGKICFGPDGMFYIGSGDGGSANDPQNNAQNRNNLLGKILRIDVDNQDPGRGYRIPPDNPFFDSTNIRKEIYALGLRNPWKMSWDFETRRLWVGDVGQTSFEEIDTIRAGGNYGWKWREGDRCVRSPECLNPRFLRPVWTYPRTLGVSVTGGQVYRGTQIPWLVGEYLYGDYGTGRIWGLSQGTDTVLVNRQLLAPTQFNVSAFAEDHRRELYVLRYNTGGIFKLVADPTASQSAAMPGLTLATAPNPADKEASLLLTLPKAAVVTLAVLGLDGTVQYRLPVSGHLAAGQHKIALPTGQWPAGMYLVQATVGTATVGKRLVVAH